MASRRSISTSTSTPASEVRRPPSKAARIDLPATEDEKAVRSCRSMTRSAAARDRLYPLGQARPVEEVEVEVGAWLSALGLERYEQAFRDHDVDADLLARLTAEDLREIGVASVGHRRRLLEAAAALRADAAPPSASPVAEPDVPRPRPKAPVGAERRQLTIMIVDLVGSTALSGRLDPEEMGELIR